jgi:NAD(P)H-hydrate epimerase
MKLVTVSQMQTIEKEADASGLTFDQMMENAGQGLADVILSLYAGESELEVVGLVGPGNNGGDTLVAMAALAAEGWKARAYLVKRKKDDLVKRFLEAGGEVLSKENPFEQLAQAVETADVFLDGIFGTGLKLPLKKDVAEVLAEVGDVLDGLDISPLIIAVDCPSGVDAETGEAADETIAADLTVTMAAVKQGMLKLPAFEYVGELKVVDIGLPADLPSLKDLKTEVVDDESVAALLPERPLESHKGTFGTALIAAGSLNYTGAALLAGEAAYRSGAGLVTLAVPGPVQSALAGRFPEATWVLLPHELGVISRDATDVLAKSFERATALLVGPGFGTEDTTKEFIENLLKGKVSVKKTTTRIGFVHQEPEKKEETNSQLPPLIFDADGLKLLAKIPDWPRLLPAPAILTPHPGEMSVLTGLSKEEIQENRQEIAGKYAQEWGHVVILKGAFTVIAAPDGRSILLPFANPALATAGSGDVLAGTIAAMVSQGLQPYEAAVCGAYVHGVAGELARREIGSAGVLAGDLLPGIPAAIQRLS